MVTSNTCWMKEFCKKYKSKDAECRTSDIFCIKQHKLDYLYSSSNLTDKQRIHQNLRIDADGTDRDNFLKLKDIQNNIEYWVSNGNNLYIYSNTTGNGKTAWSVRLIQSYLESIWYKCSYECHALFINVPKYLLAIKDAISNHNEYAEHINKHILDADLVVFDEIGSKVGTEFELENLLSIISNRIDNNKSNIYTSNLNPAQLKDKIGDRLYSRIVNSSENIEFRGKDKRVLLNDTASSIK